MSRLAAIVLAVVMATSTAHAQKASYAKGSVFDLDPPANQATGNRILEQVFQSNDMQPVADLAERDIMRRRAKPVGRLSLGLPGGALSSCTASLIAVDLLLTNYHCVPGQGNVREAFLWMGYLIPKSRRGVALYRVSLDPVEADEKLDYAVLRVDGNPGDEWGTVPLSSVTPAARQSLFIVHHPGGFAKHITLGNCRTSDPATKGDDLMHKCDTLPGSSGAPVFDNETRMVVGLHYSAVGLRGLNAGKRIASIAERSPLIARLVREQGKDQTSQHSPAAPLSEAADAWRAIENTTSPAVLEVFIGRFKDTVFANFAKARLTELKKQAALAAPPKLSAPAQDVTPAVGIFAGRYKPGDYPFDGRWKVSKAKSCKRTNTFYIFVRNGKIGSKKGARGSVKKSGSFRFRGTLGKHATGKLQKKSGRGSFGPKCSIRLTRIGH